VDGPLSLSGGDRQGLVVKYGRRPGLTNWLSPSRAGALPSNEFREIRINNSSARQPGLIDYT
jgi:hypothetical protein